MTATTARPRRHKASPKKTSPNPAVSAELSGDEDTAAAIGDRILSDRLHDGLNPQQGVALEVVEGACLLLAGAGTGKTTLEVRRIAGHLERGIDPRRLLIGSFSRDGTGELLDRAARYEERARDIIWGGTLHALFRRLLRRLAGHSDNPTGLTADFKIVSEHERQGLLLDLLEEIDRQRAQAVRLEKKGPRQLIQALGRIKGKGFRAPADGGDEAAIADLVEGLKLEHVPADLMGQLYDGYQATLRANNVADFDDLILAPLLAMRADPELGRRWGRQWDHIEVDEWQDTLTIQVEALAELHKGCPNVFVVGDDDQLLFEYAGAESANTLEFERWFPDARILKLEENYRCRPLTLQAANAVIANNASRRGKVLRPAESRAALPEGDPIRIVEAKSPGEEAATAAAIAGKALLAGRTTLIAYRVNWLSRGIEDALRRHKVPYRLIGAAPFWERPVVADALAHIRLHAAWCGIPVEPDILGEAFLRVCDRPARRVGEVTGAQAVEAVAGLEGEAAHPLRAALTLDGLRRDTREGLEAWAGQLDLVAKDTTGARAFDIIGMLIEEVGFRDFMVAEIEAKRMERDAIQHVEEVARSGWGVPDLRRWLADLEQLLATPPAADGEPAADCRSLHGAKGSEYDEVVIIGAEEGMLPSIHAVLAEKDGDERAMEAERRLFFVGLTRSKGDVTAIWTPKRSQQRDAARSRFIDEIPAGLRVDEAAVPARRPGGKSPPATPNSLSYAGRIARSLGIAMPAELDQSSVSAFIDQHKGKIQRRVLRG